MKRADLVIVMLGVKSVVLLGLLAGADLIPWWMLAASTMVSLGLMAWGTCR